MASPASSASRVAWLEKFYDIVFVACVGRFANELGANPDLLHTLTVLGWLAGLWLSWFLVTLRLNRFPDEGWTIRAIVVIQLLCTTVAAAAAISASSEDDAIGVAATAGISLGIAALYATVPRSTVTDARLLAVPIVGSIVVALATLLTLVLPRAAAVAATTVVGVGFLLVVFGYYLSRLTRNQPVEPQHAGDRHGQLFLVLMGLSFLKVAFATDPRTGVEYAAVVVAFVAGFSLWTLYVDGVLPLGFPLDAVRQRRWLAAQFALSLAITVAAAAVTALPVTATGAVTVSGVLLEGGSFVVGLLAFAMLAMTAERPAPWRAAFRAVAAAVIGVLIGVALALDLAARTFSGLLAVVLVAAALAEAVAPRVAGQGAGPTSHDDRSATDVRRGTPRRVGPDTDDPGTQPRPADPQA